MGIDRKIARKSGIYPCDYIRFLARENGVFLFHVIAEDFPTGGLLPEMISAARETMFKLKAWANDTTTKNDLWCSPASNNGH
jgi:hypothetical protein